MLEERWLLIAENCGREWVSTEPVIIPHAGEHGLEETGRRVREIAQDVIAHPAAVQLLATVSETVLVDEEGIDGCFAHPWAIAIMG